MTCTPLSVDGDLADRSALDRAHKQPRKQVTADRPGPGWALGPGRSAYVSAQPSSPGVRPLGCKTVMCCRRVYPASPLGTIEMHVRWTNEGVGPMSSYKVAQKVPVWK